MARGALMVVPPAPPAGSAKPCCVAGTPPMDTTPGTEGEPVAAAAAPAAPAATPGLAPPRSCSASCCSCMAVAGVEAVSSRKASLISCGRAISHARVCESLCWCLVVCERRERDAARAKERSNNDDLDRLPTRRDTASTANTKTKTQLLSIRVPVLDMTAHNPNPNPNQTPPRPTDTEAAQRCTSEYVCPLPPLSREERQTRGGSEQRCLSSFACSPPRCRRCRRRSSPRACLPACRTTPHPLGHLAHERHSPSELPRCSILSFRSLV